MEHFNWVELVITLFTAALSYITGHKVGSSKKE